MNQFYHPQRPSELIITEHPKKRSKSPLAPKIAPAVSLAPTSHTSPDNDRNDHRQTNRHPLQSKATVIIGEGPSSTHDITIRDMSLSGVSFLLRQQLSVGQFCKLQIGNLLHVCEVVRSRMLSNGRYEMAVMFRK